MIHVSVLLCVCDKQNILKNEKFSRCSSEAFVDKMITQYTKHDSEIKIISLFNRVATIRMEITKLHSEPKRIHPHYFHLETFRHDCRSACREGSSNFVAVDLCFPSRALYLWETLKAIRHSVLRCETNKCKKPPEKPDALWEISGMGNHNAFLRKKLRIL